MSQRIRIYFLFYSVRAYHPRSQVIYIKSLSKIFIVVSTLCSKQTEPPFLANHEFAEFEGLYSVVESQLDSRFKVLSLPCDHLQRPKDPS